MSNHLSPQEKQQINNFFENNYDDLLKNSRSNEEFLKNLGEKEEKDYDIQNIAIKEDIRSEFNDYISDRRAEFSEKFDKDNEERAKKRKRGRRKKRNAKRAELSSKRNKFIFL